MGQLATGNYPSWGFKYRLKFGPPQILWLKKEKKHYHH